MLPHDATGPVAQRQERPVWIIAVLLAGGLLGHVIAAYVSGGARIAYIHHVLGFFLIAAVTGLPIAILTRLFWRQHADRAWLGFGLVQLALGVLIMVNEW